MKPGLLFIGTTIVVLATSCGFQSKYSSSSVAAVGDHFEAKNCEIFVDKVRNIHSSHGVHNIDFFVKILNSRLDSAIAAVGLRQQVTSQSIPIGEPRTGEWRDDIFSSYFGASDYFQGSVYLGSEFSSNRVEGVFFVRTVKGTTYWLKAGDGSDGSNFQINDTLYFQIREKDPAGYKMIPTQNDEELRALNPKACF